MFSSRQATLIYNPIAGFWDWSTVLSKVAHFWAARGWTMHIESTRYAGHAIELAQAAAAAGHELVFAAGGDGTLNEVANGLIGTAAVLAPMPVGTANSFAKELGLLRPNLLQQGYLLEVSKALALGRIQAMDVGQCDDGRYWLLWASTGFDGYLISHIEPRAKWFKRLGPAGYAAKAMLFMPQFEGIRATVTVDDQTEEDEFLLMNVSNCRMWMGGELKLNYDAVLDDGLFEVWLFRGKHWPRMLNYGLQISREDHASDPNVTVLRGRSVTVETATPVPYHLDGEPSTATPLRTTLRPAALRILTPSTAPADLFSLPGKPLEG